MIAMTASLSGTLDVMKGMGHLLKQKDISKEGTELDRQSSQTSEYDESEWWDGNSYFKNITRVLDENPVICSDLTREGSEVDYFLSILTEEIPQIIWDQKQRRKRLRKACSENGQLSLEAHDPGGDKDIHCNTYIDGYSRAARDATIMV
jgi:hypothetical protein